MFFFENNNFFKSSFDALDGLYSPDQPRVVEAVLNNSFEKGHLQATNVFAHFPGTQNDQKSTPNLSKIEAKMVSKLT